MHVCKLVCGFAKTFPCRPPTVRRRRLPAARCAVLRALQPVERNARASLRSRIMFRCVRLRIRRAPRRCRLGEREVLRPPYNAGPRPHAPLSRFACGGQLQRNAPPRTAAAGPNNGLKSTVPAGRPERTGQSMKFARSRGGLSAFFVPELRTAQFGRQSTRRTDRTRETLQSPLSERNLYEKHGSLYVAFNRRSRRGRRPVRR
jgi:hypothetical protein